MTIDWLRKRAVTVHDRDCIECRQFAGNLPFQMISKLAVELRAACYQYSYDNDCYFKRLDKGELWICEKVNLPEYKGQRKVVYRLEVCANE